MLIVLIPNSNQDFSGSTSILSTWEVPLHILKAWLGKTLPLHERQ